MCNFKTYSSFETIESHGCYPDAAYSCLTADPHPPLQGTFSSREKANRAPAVHYQVLNDRKVIPRTLAPPCRAVIHRTLAPPCRAVIPRTLAPPCRAVIPRTLAPPCRAVIPRTLAPPCRAVIPRTLAPPYSEYDTLLFADANFPSSVAFRASFPPTGGSQSRGSHCSAKPSHLWGEGAPKGRMRG